MKTLVIIVILAAAGWFGWKYLNKIDVEGTTAKQAEQFDREVKEQGFGQNKAIGNLPPSGQTASPHTAPVARTVERMRDADAAMKSRNEETP
ncbi:hypothetical protein QQ056_14665 [Oscillatoria laete-virens NRMC-F 0139]|nr:hypothetical protein [Oscillatoria laete-virens]MDL5054779.1 hypothetical protein [Oscillatoria laete-virens NRMC-F 0139]